MTRPLSRIWKHPFPGWEKRLDRLVEDCRNPCAVFFRADDIGFPGREFTRLMGLFRGREIPLNLAVVPAWLTPGRWEALSALAGEDARLWCWHQHGARHINHEAHGKKQEFGDSREESAIKKDLLRGRCRLEKIMGGALYPAFTFPWNRSGEKALRVLRDQDFRLVSRSAGSRPPAPDGLASLDVDVDLHTTRPADPAQGWESLFRSLETALSRPACGIMIHHQRANAPAFAFLDRLAGLLKDSPNMRFFHFGERGGGIRA